MPWRAATRNPSTFCYRDHGSRSPSTWRLASSPGASLSAARRGALRFAYSRSLGKPFPQAPAAWQNHCNPVRFVACESFAADCPWNQSRKRRFNILREQSLVTLAPVASRGWGIFYLRKSSGSFATFAAMRRGSSSATRIAQLLIWVQTYRVEYRGIRYTIRAGIEREQWSVTIHPAGVEMKGRSSADHARKQNCKRAP